MKGKERKGIEKEKKRKEKKKKERKKVGLYGKKKEIKEKKRRKEKKKRKEKKRKTCCASPAVHILNLPRPTSPVLGMMNDDDPKRFSDFSENWPSCSLI